MSAIQSFLTTLAALVSPPTRAPDLIVGPGGRHMHTLVREGYELQSLCAPNRPTPGHEFGDVYDFAAWVERHAPVAQRAHVLVDQYRVDAVYQPDDSTAWHVRCHLVAHPRGARWLNVLDKSLDQQELYRLFVSGSDDFEDVVDRQGNVLGKQGREIAAQLRKLQVSRDAKVDVELDENGEYRASSASDKVTVSAKLPSEFDVTVPLYDGVYDKDDDEYTYTLHLHLDVKATGDGPTTFVLRCPDLAVVRRQALRDVVWCLRTRLADLRGDDGENGPAFLVGIGVADMRTQPGVIPHGSDGARIGPDGTDPYFATQSLISAPASDDA
jgi:hypothetical protein